MLEETNDFTGCEDICGDIETLTVLELSFDGYITGSISSPAK